MRLGLIGPANGDTKLLAEATDFLIDSVGAAGVVYLGIDETVEALARTQGATAGPLFGPSTVRAAVRGSPDDIRKTADSHRRTRRLQRIQTVPYPPTRAVEMIDDRIVMVVYDKSVLDEEDIINASVIVYGKSRELFFKRFGPRAFFTPGPLGAGKVGVLHHEADGRGVVAAYDLTGASVLREPLYGRTAKVVVSS